MSRPAGGPGRPVDLSPADAWALVRSLSPHPRVRIADIDENGQVTNSYRSSTPASGPPPAAGVPYALHLADERGRYRLLGFDLDAHKGPVAADLARLRTMLTRARLAHVVCASGPGGGRHVWVALAEPAAATVVAGIARGLAELLPSLDISPLTNPRTGALRPPGAPHRSGGRSAVLDGRLADLYRPTGTAAQVLALAGLVHAEQTVAEPTGSPQLTTRDPGGHRCLPGPRRPLSARTYAALHDRLPDGADASTVLAAALCGAVRARWHLADILAMLPTAPGLLHARTERTSSPIGGRRPRPVAEQTAVLTRQWDRAVDTVAARGRVDQVDQHIAGADPTYETRCAVVVDAIAAVQRRADTSPGRWARGGGPADRRVLDVACHLMLTAVRLDIELDVRRLALLAGIGRGTAHLALQRLTTDGGWLTPSTAAAGVHGAHWALPHTPTAGDQQTSVDPSTQRADQGRTQGTPSPLPAPTRLRAAWLSHLTHRTTQVLHDALTATGLGHHTARVYQALATSPVDVLELTNTTGYSPHRLRRYLDQLADHRLARTDRVGRWMLAGHQLVDRLDRVARTFGVHGTLVDRGRRYRIEREAWAWWLDELEWRRLPAAQKRRTPGAGQTVIPLAGHDTLTRHHRGPHPRTSTGRADFRAARQSLRDLRDVS